MSKKSPQKTLDTSPKSSPLFKSVRRTYREEIPENNFAPSLFALAGETFSLIWQKKRLFLPLILFSVIAIILSVGLLSQSTIELAKSSIDSSIESSTSLNSSSVGEFARAGLLLLSTLTTGGLNSSLSTGGSAIIVIVFLIIFLVSIYIIRFTLAQKHITLRDALYNSLSPLLSVLAIFLLILVELTPVFIFLIFLNAAIKTDFLATPFYALIFLAFSALMITLSSYLVSSSLLAMVAVSAPGLYPASALRSSKKLIFRHRVVFILRLFFLIFIISLISTIILLPVILLDNFIKLRVPALSAVPVVSFFLLLTTCFSFVYISVYLYLFYRKLLDYSDTHPQ